MTKVIKFYATWCGPCKAYAPVFNKVAEELGNDVEFVDIDVDQDTSGLAAEYKVMSIPTTVVIKEGNNVSRKTGGMSENELKSLIFN